MLKHRTNAAAAALVRRYPSGPRPLAEPPAGSGLEPVLGQPGLPVLGYSLSLAGDLLGFLRHQHDTYGQVSWSGFLGQNVVWALGPDAQGAVFPNAEKAFSCGDGWGTFLIPFFSRGLMLLEFE